MAATETPRLIDRLPALKGRVSEGALLSAVTWFQVGGPAEVMVRPRDLEDLTALLRGRPTDVPLLVLGVGSNLLVRDGGLDGIVLRLGRGFAGIAVEDGHRLRVGAAALDLNVSLAARDAGIAGLEFLRGIPGTIGGAFRTNAGAYGAELADVLVEATVVDGTGKVMTLTPDAFHFAYRHSDFPADWIVTEAVLQGRPGVVAEIAARMDEIAAAREASQPVRSRTGGSTFKNPPGARAWELVDAAGCRGLRRGAAVVSERHCNFLINEGGASAADIEGLGEDVRRRVFESSGIELEWEIMRLGRHGQAPAREVTP
ncbi:UDP-N-acetylmuramate dehydrogenase [Zavarzinia compransoris]|uniref:UDP-N-acetylmuramate dehydrogenase n=1 Tax=Zavarzinia marina TaxID=2911065 RepID=UPI001F2C1D3A|nr:UDP-N-acetylmuramate dehydrogenase [Zavarzinia marina]MCF4167068.1 UDP-N-acetylmuramate dehydrogenase [Zavarzinia marina]